MNLTPNVTHQIFQISIRTTNNKGNQKGGFKPPVKELTQPASNQSYAHMLDSVERKAKLT